VQSQCSIDNTLISDFERIFFERSCLKAHLDLNPDPDPDPDLQQVESKDALPERAMDLDRVHAGRLVPVLRN
jgi:hypothetical protein